MRSVQIEGGPDRAVAHVDAATQALQVIDVGGGGGGGTTTVVQSTHDNLNANANLQVGDADVTNLNPVPVSDAGGSLTVDGTVGVSNFPASQTVDQPTHDNLNANVNLQVGNADADISNPVPIYLTNNFGALLSVSGGSPASGFGIPAFGQTQNSWPILSSGQEEQVRISTAGEVLVRSRLSSNSMSIYADVCQSGTEAPSPSAGLLPMGVVHNHDSVELVTDTCHHLTLDTTGRLRVELGTIPGLTTESLAAPATPNLLPIAVERDDVLSSLAEADGDWGHLRMDSEGALWVRSKGDTVTTDHLSGSTNGQPIQITGTTSGTAVTLHTASSTDIDRVFIDLTNTSDAPVIVTLEFGSTGTGNEVDVPVPPNDTVRAVDGAVIGGAASQVITAYADTGSVVNVLGRAETLS